MLDLYKLAVEMADRVSARRGNANAFFLTAETTLVTVQGVAFAATKDPSWSVVVSLAAAGVALSCAWWLQLRSYRDLNRAKFAVILDLEKGLPVAIYSDEWTSLKKDHVKRWRDRYAELGSVERAVPFVFVAIYMFLAIGVLNS